MSTSETTSTEAPKPQPKRVEHFTVEERAARGKAARAELPRKIHADWEPAPNRRDPVELLEEQAASRVQELVPVRYGRMLVSPFAFFRGAAYVMASDLAGVPRTGLQVQLCGDAHLSNFGFYAAPDRRLVFGVNDFDETLPGPFEWDLARLVASFAVAGRDRGFDAKQRRAINRHGDARVPGGDEEFRGNGHPLRVVCADRRRRRRSVAFSGRLSLKQMSRLRTRLLKTRKDNLRRSESLCDLVDGELRIVGNPPLITPIEDVGPADRAAHSRTLSRRMLRTYRGRCHATVGSCSSAIATSHAARKVVGVGSVGTRAWFCFCSAATTMIRCSSSSRRRRRRCSSRSSARASSPSTASASSTASG